MDTEYPLVEEQAARRALDTIAEIAVGEQGNENTEPMIDALVQIRKIADDVLRKES